jgi:hypothetical protein
MIRRVEISRRYDSILSTQLGYDINDQVRVVGRGLVSDPVWLQHGM